NAGLVEEGRERGCDVFACGLGDSGEELGDGGGLVGILLHVELYAVAEFVGANPGFEHADDGRAFFVGDGVEGVRDIVVGGDGLADLASVDQAVGSHGAEALIHLRGIDVPFGLPLADDLAFHPGGESFVEPDVVPPGGGHQVAKPLVRHFVGGDDGTASLTGNG